jgi:hypothetical protein
MERRTRAEWSGLVDEHEASDQSQATFCRRRGIAIGTFRWWIWKLGRRRRASRQPSRAIRLVPVDVVESAGVAEPGGETIALELADLTLRIATGTSPEYVASLVAALRSGC